MLKLLMAQFNFFIDCCCACTYVSSLISELLPKIYTCPKNDRKIKTYYYKLVLSWHHTVGLASLAHLALDIKCLVACREPLRGALRPVHVEPVADDEVGHGGEDVLAVLQLLPLRHQAAGLLARVGARQAGVPVLEKGREKGGKLVDFAISGSPTRYICDKYKYYLPTVVQGGWKVE